MTADPVLVMSWLVLAHLTADFVLQTGRLASDKFASGFRAFRGLAIHASLVALCLAPVVWVFGDRGALLLVVVTVAHALIDRSKVVLTRRVEAAALREAHRAHQPAAPVASLGRAWTPVPAALFVADQAAHVAVLWLAWAALLRDAVPLPAAAATVSSIAAGDPVGFQRTVVTIVVLTSLGIVNIRVGSLFVGILVRPLPSLETRDPVSRETASGDPSRPPSPAYAVRLGPFVGRLEPEQPVEAPGPRLPSPVRVGEAIGILERLLIVALMLARAEAAIGLVIAAKTLARFRQLDDREFAEYYLLGTLASVAVAVGSALVAAAALGLAI